MIDLHTHTNFSDATVSLPMLLQKAQELGISLLSICDHNTVSAYAALTDYRHLFGGKILPGVELNCIYNGNTIEILGYGIDVRAVDKITKEIAITGTEFAKKQLLNDISTLCKKGVVFDGELIAATDNQPVSILNRAKTVIGGTRALILQEMRKHPENERFFENGEFYTCTRHVFLRNYLNNVESPLFVDRSGFIPSLEKASDMIRSCGGLVFLAHLYNYSQNVIDDLDGLTKDKFLDGIECCYGTFTKPQKQTLCKYCEQNGLYMSGGSDFHGLDMRPDNIMGLSAGEPIPFEVIAPWFDKVKDSVI